MHPGSFTTDSGAILPCCVLDSSIEPATGSLTEAKDKTAGTDAPQESGQFTGEWCQFRRAFHLLAILPRNWRMASSDEMSSKDSHSGWLFGDTIGETDQEGTFSELVLTVSNKNVTPDPDQTQFRPGHYVDCCTLISKTTEYRLIW